MASATPRRTDASTEPASSTMAGGPGTSSAANRGNIAIRQELLHAVGAVATLLYGLDWLRVFEPLAENAVRETSYALPSRLEQLGLPHALSIGLAAAAAAAGLAWIARDAWRGVPRHGRAACLVLATTPYLAVWYLAWAVPLAAVDEDRVARVAALALTAYLLPQTIPL